MHARRNRWLSEIILMLILSGLVYLPFITQFGYYNDDWYSMYAARVAGTNAFHEMYSIDRPGRAYVMIPLYQFFQGNPLYYSIAAYLLRVLGALALLWVLRLLWPERKRETLLVALLFLLYPGFLSMPNAIDFQSHLVGILLAFVSLGLSIYGFYQPMGWRWIICWLGAVLTGWAYLSQMEYYIGFEAVRLLLFGLIVYREGLGWRPAMIKLLKKWLPYSIIPIGYLIWRIFIFNNERATTDVGLQLGALVSTPVTTLYNWTTGFVQSVLNVTLLAWSVPLSQLGFNLDTPNSIRGILMALAVMAIALAALRLLKYSDASAGETIDRRWMQEMLVVGLAWAGLGLIAVVLGNRIVAFPAYSRYGMVSAAGAILAVISGISYISDRRIQATLLAFLFFSAALTHYGNGYLYAQNANSMRQFWWQVAWRVPQFRQGSTLIASYPNSGIREDSFVWGPANHIYYPYRVKPNKVQAGVSAILLDHDAVIRILNRDGQVFRKHIIVDTYRNYRNFVILTQPSWASCLHVIDGTRPEYSQFELDTVMAIEGHSEIENVLLNEEFKTPPQFLFGPEPAHNWCYYYEKADYERQRGDWDMVRTIGEQAFSQGLYPADPIEWMPFLQAYVYAGNSEKLQEMAPQVAQDVYVLKQVCASLKAIPSTSQEVQTVIEEKYCTPQQVKP